MQERERRSGVRVPINCEAVIVPAAPQTRRPAICIDLGVGGMTLHTQYVPRPDEIFDVLVKPPQSPLESPMMHARVQVRRCQAIPGSSKFMLGVKIIEIVR
ncbi:PilZ domain-containing protein [Niveibacterium sp. SC-1]|uniref:PilZ domain-containing protein n=1 Tax=Niveibacterium sp. SC-1 TaxID=3135646 RepID=UPI00311F4F5B